MTMIGLPRTDAPIIEVDGKQYAQLPEGWPAAEDKDLEEAHAEAVANQEPEDDGLDGWERHIYGAFTPADVKEIILDWSRLAQENAALRKGMKTMQRKTRKQNQVQRRLERRLNQARASRDRHADSAETYRGIAKVNEAAAFELSMQQLAAGETVVL